MSRSRSRSRSQEDRGKRDDRSRRREKDTDHHRNRSTRSRSRSRDDERRSKDDRNYHRRDSRDRDHHRDHDRDRDRDRDRGRDRDRERDRDRDREKQPTGHQGFTPLGKEDTAITERGRGTTLPARMDVEGNEGDISSSSSSSSSYPSKDDRHTNTSTGTTATSTLMEMRSLAWGNQAKEEELTHPTVPVVAEEDKVKADFGLSGALAKDKNTGNMYNGVVLKWTEPLDSARPTKKWRLYVFKSGEVVETLHLHRQTAYLFGRDTRIADVILQHESCSKQHAVLQYRMVQDTSSSIPSSSSAAGGGGGKRGVVKPYLMDLGSTHKTYLNGTALEEARYYELKEKDCLTFAGSTREYILLHDSSNEGK